MNTIHHQTIDHTYINDSDARHNVLILSFAGAILGSQLPVHFLLGGLAGQILAPNKSLATLPISVTILVSMFAAPTLATFMNRYGRKPGFFLGVLGGGLGAICSVYALSINSFTLFIVGAGLAGVYMAAQGQYRFAATDIASPAFRPKAISWVMTGGLASAVIGTQIIKLTSNILEPIPFAGSFVAVALLNLFASPLLFWLKLPRSSSFKRTNTIHPHHLHPRSMKEIFGQPRLRVAVFCGMVFYALMNLVMTSTPLVIVGCGFSVDESANVIMAHVLAMFGPSFFTGHLIIRFGAEKIIATGLILLSLCGAIAITGVTLLHFYTALVLLGLGWNFGFIGATDMLTSIHRPEERAKVQGLNDFLVFGLVAVASFSSGALLNGLGNGDIVYGWSVVNYTMVPFLILAGGVLVWLAMRRNDGLGARQQVH